MESSGLLAMSSTALLLLGVYTVVSVLFAIVFACCVMVSSDDDAERAEHTASGSGAAGSQVSRDTGDTAHAVAAPPGARTSA